MLHRLTVFVLSIVVLLLLVERTTSVTRVTPKKPKHKKQAHVFDPDNLIERARSIKEESAGHRLGNRHPQHEY